MDLPNEEIKGNGRIAKGSAKKIAGTYVVFSDIQGNFGCLNRFLKTTKGIKKNGLICLGDIVNKMSEYSDNLCIELVKNNTNYCVRGNHEDRVSERTNEKILQENREYVKALPSILDLGSVVMFHAGSRSPVQHIKKNKEIKEEAMQISLNYPKAKIVLFGHSHQRGAYAFNGHKLTKYDGANIQLDEGKLNLINPGGIGLWQGFEKTFAIINFDNMNLRFLTLEDAEKMAQRANIVSAFDDRWMPNLNEDSYGWFLQYAKKDIPSLIHQGQRDPLLRDLSTKLDSFSAQEIGKFGRQRKKQYLETFSLELAECIGRIRDTISDVYETADPIKSRQDFLDLKRRKY